MGRVAHRIAWHGVPSLDDDVLARRTIAFPGSPLVEIIEKRPGLLTQQARRAVLWSLLLPFAAAIAAAAKKLTITTKLTESTAQIDAAAIQQARLNLLDNAVKFSPQDATITLTIDPAPDGGWLIRVTDEGPGIPPADRQRVFDLFQRLGNELRRETQGCGIGLGIVKSIVEAHGGRVAIADTQPPGTTVAIHLTKDS